MCKNTDQPTCNVVAVAVLERVVGIDPFPALPERLKQVAMALPLSAGHQRELARNRQPQPAPSLLGRLLDWLLGSWGKRT